MWSLAEIAKCEEAEEYDDTETTATNNEEVPFKDLEDEQVWKEEFDEDEEGIRAEDLLDIDRWDDQEKETEKGQLLFIYICPRPWSTVDMTTFFPPKPVKTENLNFHCHVNG